MRVARPARGSGERSDRCGGSQLARHSGAFAERSRRRRRGDAARAHGALGRRQNAERRVAGGDTTTRGRRSQRRSGRPRRPHGAGGRVPGAQRRSRQVLARTWSESLDECAALEESCRVGDRGRLDRRPTCALSAARGGVDPPGTQLLAGVRGRAPRPPRRLRIPSKFVRSGGRRSRRVERLRPHAPVARGAARPSGPRAVSRRARRRRQQSE
mmetsp:Transcript_12478/g.37636  ORF Transcript_12478/g.37636 Transcript_12478/m.37636 type:complete len:213 (+) Transcript_12478:229-867(+)